MPTLINGKEVEKIVGVVRDENMELQILFKYKDDAELEFIPASVANLEVPQMIIQYYEKHICFDPNKVEKVAKIKNNTKKQDPDIKEKVAKINNNTNKQDPDKEEKVPKKNNNTNKQDPDTNEKVAKIKNNTNKQDPDLKEKVAKIKNNTNKQD